MRFLGGARRFWVLIGLGVVAWLAMLFIWVIPAGGAANEAERRWRDAVDGVEKMQSVSERIPSERSKNDWLDYRKWLDDEAQIVENYFAERAQALTESITGQGEVKPIAFKEYYRQEVDKRRKWLTQNKQMVFANPAAAFPLYDWMTGSNYPRVEDVPDILRQYWARVKLYHIFLACDVRLVTRLEIGRVSPAGDEFTGLPLQADVSLPPEKINAFIEALLRVSPSSRDRDRPVIALNRVEIKPDPVAGKLIKVQVDGVIVLWKTAQPGGGKP
jgi:hypothetical protein